MSRAKYISEILFAGIDISESKRKKMVSEGSLRKIANKVYTPIIDEDLEVVVRRNAFCILGFLFPHAVISHRSAFELRQTEKGDIFLTYKYTKNVKLPGLTVHLLEGHPGTERDMPFIENLFISSAERRTLENLQAGRARGSASKCLSRADIENYLEKHLQVNGEKGLNEFRDRAREYSHILGMESEFEKLNSIIGALLQTRPASVLTSPGAMARAVGEPFDAERLKIFEILFTALHNEQFEIMAEPNVESSAFRNFAFFESYFSNYIEGTEFEIDEARRIVETGLPLPARNADSHDVLGTFQIVSSRTEMRRTPSSPDELIDILQDRHRVIMSARPDRHPGMFKMQNNHAGDTHFVDCTLVRGTLRKGFEYYQALDGAFAKALFMLFMISEVHPFADGNGRISRIMMNAEMVAADQSKIIIPTVFRDDYLNALRRLTRRKDPSVFIRAMSRVRKFSANIQGNDFEETCSYLEQCNAFKNSDGHVLRF